MTARAQVITYICLILEILFIEQFIQKGKKRYIVALALNAILLANCHAALFPMYFVVFLPYIAEYLISFINKKNLLTLKLKILEKKDENADPKIVDMTVISPDRYEEFLGGGKYKFYEDENYEYYYSSHKTEVVTVYFKSGDSMTVEQALKEGKITIECFIN